MVNLGFKTCPTCAGYIGCSTYQKHYKNIQALMPPETEMAKIHVSAAFIAEACPEYFKIPG